VRITRRNCQLCSPLPTLQRQRLPVLPRFPMFRVRAAVSSLRCRAGCEQTGRGGLFQPSLVLHLPLPGPELMCPLGTSETRRRTMQMGLCCRACRTRFVAPPDTPALEVLDRMIDDGPWFGLAEGETFGDMIFAALTSRGAIRCPECCKPVSVSEESLGQMAMNLLTHS